jgi:hypothetical protein
MHFKNFLNLLGLDRFAETISLHFIAVIFTQERDLVVRFDALGYDPQIQLLSQRNHRGGDRPVTLTDLKIADEGLVDLQPSHRKSPERA